MGLSRSVNRPIGPGQKRSSSERNWLQTATRVLTRSSRARVRACSALVWSESGSSTRKRWLSVRASSQSTNASNRSDLPPETRNRARVAATWLGCNASTRNPCVQQPLDQQPIGPLDRDQLHLEPHPRPAQRPQPSLVMRERRAEQLRARLV